MKLLSLVVLAVLLTVSSPAQAHNFFELDGKTVFQDKTRTFRLRLPDKPWQLAEAAGQLNGSVLFKGAIFSLANGRVSRSTDGLSFETFDSLPVLSSAHLVSQGDFLLLSGTHNGTTQFWRYSGTSWQTTAGLDLEEPQEAAGAYLDGAALRLVLLRGDVLRPYSLNGLIWEEAPGALCEGAFILTEPFVASRCQDGRTLRLAANLEWQALFPQNVGPLSHSSLTVAASSLTDPDLLFIASADETVAVQLSAGAAPEAVSVAHQRVLIRFSGLGLYELLYRQAEPSLVWVTQVSGSIVGAKNDPETVLVSAAGTAYISSAAGQWQELGAQGNFNHVEKVGPGWLAYQVNATKTSGGLAQLLPFGADSFIKVNPWASTTSPIQATLLETGPAYISVITSSGTGNTNLYRSNDFVSWSRITLPTAPTLKRTVAQARLLGAGTLVELSGVVSVPRGVVSGEVIYLQDHTGGIQLYLNQSRGQLDRRKYDALTATGEISSSAVKRLIIGAPDDVTLEGVGELTAPLLALGELPDRLGQVVSLRETITQLTKDNAVLAETLKVHLQALGRSAREVFALKDTVELSVVVDWNSSSGKVEAWYLGEPYSITQSFHSVAPTPQQSSVAVAPTKAVTKPTASVKPAVALQVATVNRQAAPTLVQGEKAGTFLGSGEGSATETAGTPTGLMSFLSLAVGMLAMKGRRFRQVFDGS
jgi:hypothetical protein